MHSFRVILWSGAVGISFFGWGLAVLRILKQKTKWLTAAGAGVAVTCAFLGIMNLLEWIRPLPILILIFAGDLLFALLCQQTHPPSEYQNGMRTSQQPGLKGLTWVALALIGFSAGAGIHNKIVNYFDDPQAYFAYPLETLQTGHLQPQPFSERRINTSLGANYLLQSIMAVCGDVRSLGFLDQTFALLIYAAAIWATADTVGLSFEKKGVVLVLVIALPLIQTNVVPTFLQSAMAVLLLLAMHETAACKESNVGSGLLWGLLVSVLCLTKSSGIVFAVPLVAIFAILHSVRTRSLGQIKNAAIAALAVFILAMPWMIQQHRNEGTYLSPLLGRGFHASRWGVLPPPMHTATPLTIAMSMLPNVLLLLVATFLAWKLRCRSRSFDLSIVAFMLAALIATPLIAFGTGGEGVDRFSFPFYVPTILMFTILLLASVAGPITELPWLRFGKVTLLVWVMGLLAFLALHYHIHRLYLHRLETAVGMTPEHLGFYELVLDDAQMIAEEARSRSAQYVVPRDQEILESTLFAYTYDFRRNKIFIADYPGMAALAPGIPVGQGPGPLRDYFQAHNIRYYICDRRLTFDNEDIGEFLRSPTLDISVRDFVLHHVHDVYPWSRMESAVSRDVRHNLLSLADSNRRLYDDGTLVTVQLGSSP